MILRLKYECNFQKIIKSKSNICVKIWKKKQLYIIKLINVSNNIIIDDYMNVQKLLQQ